jgi:hypothetical protein
MDLTTFLEPKIDLPRIAELLDGLGHEGRVHTIHTWGRRQQSALFEAAKGFRPIDLSHLVPSGVLVPFEHQGFNTVGAFSDFSKVFANVGTDAEPVIVGYNEGMWRAFSGPGYFSAANGEGEHQGEIVLDYRRIPTRKVDAWPPIRPNDGLIGSIAFGGMVDYLRGISTHVSIGTATKDGKSRNMWFALVRRDPS